MKIFMRNIGMTLHVIHKLRAEGIDNVQVNMDWQHLIMNGENLAEYAALLAAEGLLGHQHANSGWGTFDDDNMVGATAFMETLELAIELRRANYGANGERLGFDLYPYTEDAVGAVKRSVLQWNFIDGVAGKIDEPALREAQQDEGRRPRVRARLRGARRIALTSLIGIDVGTSGVKGVAISPSGEVLATAEERYPLSTPQPGWSEQDPEDWWRAAQACLARLPDGPDRLLGPDARARHARRGSSACCGRRSSGTTSAPAAECAEIEERVGLERLIELTGNRALTGFTAPKLLWLRTHEPEAYDADRAHPAAEGLRAAAARGRARDRRRRRLRERCSSTSANRRWSDEVLRRARDPARVAAARRTSRPRSPAPATRPRARSASASTRPGRSRSCSAPRASSSACCPRYGADAAGARAHLLPRGAGHVARDGRDAAAPPARCVAARHALGGDYRGCWTTRRRRWPPGAEGLLFAPYLDRRANAPPRPGRARGVHRPDGAPRPRRARGAPMLEGVAYGLRDSLELLRALGVRAERRPRLGRRRAQRPLVRDRRDGARPAARADGVRRRLGLRRGAARRGPRRASSPTRTRPSLAASA